MTGADNAGPRDATLRIFTVLWAVAAIFHLISSYNAIGFITTPTPDTTVHALVGVAALWLLVRPGHLLAMSALAVVSVISVWFEAPVMGNHWVLAGFIDLAFLLTLFSAAVRRVGLRAQIYSTFLPAARWCLIGFYAFAAFSKMNSAFVDPTVSCGNYFLAESASSYGIDATWLQSGWFSHLVPWFVIAIEAAVPTLLVITRTRLYGVCLGFAFHSLIALDLTHLFFDFSSLLLALFVLFLPSSFFEQADSRLITLKRRLPIPSALVLVVFPLVLLWLLWTSPPSVGQPLIVLRVVYWFAFDLILLVALTKYTKPGIAAGSRLGGRRQMSWVAVIPALVIFNGLTPYLEIKTGYGWNMYSNLVTVDGKTNHFLVPATAHLTHYQDRPIKVINSNDGSVEAYATDGFLITELQLRIYLAHHPLTALTYVQGGQLVVLKHASQNPALVEPVSPIVERVLSFRAIDPGSPNRCQPNFQPLT